MVRTDEGGARFSVLLPGFSRQREKIKPSGALGCHEEGSHRLVLDR
jgi:hypothetical protein